MFCKYKNKPSSVFGRPFYHLRPSGRLRWRGRRWGFSPSDPLRPLPAPVAWCAASSLLQATYLRLRFASIADSWGKSVTYPTTHFTTHILYLLPAGSYSCIAKSTIPALPRRFGCWGVYIEDGGYMWHRASLNLHSLILLYTLLQYVSC